MLMLAVSLALAVSADVDLCHSGGLLNVNVHATPAHVGHGDWVITEEQCGDGVDDDCDGEIDEGCCPCYTLDDLLTWFDADNQCYDYAIGEPPTFVGATYLADYEGAGLAAGVGDYFFYPAPFCAVIDLTNTGLIDFTITADEYDACEAMVLEAAATLEIACSDVSPVE